MKRIWRPWKLSGPPHPTCPTTSKILSPLDLGCPISNKPPSPNSNQLEENIIQGRLLLSGSSFRSALVSDIKSLILSGFPLTSLYLASWSITICFFVALYSRVCSCPKISRNIFCLLIIYILGTHFAINLFYSHNLKK